MLILNTLLNKRELTYDHDNINRESGTYSTDNG